LVRHVDAETTRINDYAAVRVEAEAIDAARKLIDEAADLDIPTASYVANYGKEIELPEDWRDPSRMTGGK